MEHAGGPACACRAAARWLGGGGGAGAGAGARGGRRRQRADDCAGRADALGLVAARPRSIRATPATAGHRSAWRATGQHPAARCRARRAETRQRASTPVRREQARHRAIPRGTATAAPRPDAAVPTGARPARDRSGVSHPPLRRPPRRHWADGGETPAQNLRCRFHARAVRAVPAPAGGAAPGSPLAPTDAGWRQPASASVPIPPPPMPRGSEGGSAGRGAGAGGPRRPHGHATGGFATRNLGRATVSPALVGTRVSVYHYRGCGVCRHCASRRRSAGNVADLIRKHGACGDAGSWVLPVHYG